LESGRKEKGQCRCGEGGWREGECVRRRGTGAWSSVGAVAEGGVVWVVVVVVGVVSELS